MISFKTSKNNQLSILTLSSYSSKFLWMENFPVEMLESFLMIQNLELKKTLKKVEKFQTNGLEGIRGISSGRRCFDFASSNDLWKASLDTIDFMPLRISKL